MDWPSFACGAACGFGLALPLLGWWVRSLIGLCHHVLDRWQEADGEWQEVESMQPPRVEGDEWKDA